MAFSQCSFRNVKALSVSFLVLVVALVNEHHIDFNYWTNLVINYCGDDLSILPHILKRLPALEVLILNRLQDCSQRVQFEAWKQENCEINCLKYTLKTLQLGRFIGNGQEMPILEYFMENATALNEVRTSTKLISETKSENAILKKISTYPRCSNAFKVIICHIPEERGEGSSRNSDGS